MKILFSFFFLLLISVPVFAQTTEKELDKTIITEPKMLQTVTIDEITLGSAVTGVEVIVSINAKPDQKCYLKLLDDYLTNLQISDVFPCAGINTITLNQLGQDALESNISKGIYKIGAVFADETGSLADFTILGYHVSYKEPTYFAEIEKDKVVRVIVADQNYINSLQGDWIETKLDNSIRGVYAGIGYNYDPILDSFIPPIEKDIIILK